MTVFASSSSSFSSITFEIFALSLSSNSCKDVKILLIAGDTAEVVSTAFIIELDPLKGREKIESQGYKVISMLNYDLD